MALCDKRAVSARIRRPVQIAAASVGAVLSSLARHSLILATIHKLVLRLLRYRLAITFAASHTDCR